MRKCLHGGLTILVTLALCCQLLVPLYAAPDLDFRILQPLADTAISGTTIPLAVAFQSQADAPVVRFDAYLDSVWLIGGTIRNPIPAGSFRTDADFADLKVKPGRHTLYLKLITSQGTMVQHEQQITIQPSGTLKPETNPPTVRIVSPAAGNKLTGRTMVRMEASDDSGITWVKLYVNNKLVGMTNEAPYELPLDPIADRYEAGTYTLTARAEDLFGNATISTPVTIGVISRNGRTTIDAELNQTSEIDMAGILPVTMLALPSGGPGLERQPFATLMSPLSDWTDPAGLLPTMQFSDMRLAQFSTPTADALTILPLKLSPAAEAGQLPLLISQGFTTAPALAAAPSQLAPIVPMPGSFTPQRGLLQAPTADATLPTPDKMTVPPGTPVLVIAMDTVMSATKSSPAQHGSASDAMRATHSTTPLLIAKAPVLGSAGTATARATAPSTRPDALTARLSTDSSTALLPSTTTALSSRTVPTLPGETPAKTALAPTKATPAAGSLSSDDNVVFVAIARADTTSATPARTSAVRSITTAAVAKADHAVELRAPYTVKTGDTLQKIARAYSTTPDQLRQLNPGISPQHPLVADSRIVVPQPAAHLYLDSAALKGGPQPFVVRGYAMVPFRKIVEGKQGVVIWIPKTREINAWANKTFMGLTIGSRTARINREVYQLPVAASLRESRTMVPLRYVATAMKLHVEYNTATGTYYLISRAAL